MDWDVLTRGHRWENPLMGWQSTGDAMHATDMFFKSKEDAIHFAEKQGMQCVWASVGWHMLTWGRL